MQDMIYIYKSLGSFMFIHKCKIRRNDKFRHKGIFMYFCTKFTIVE